MYLSSIYAIIIGLAQFKQTTSSNSKIVAVIISSSSTTSSRMYECTSTRNIFTYNIKYIYYLSYYGRRSTYYPRIVSMGDWI